MWAQGHTAQGAPLPAVWAGRGPQEDKHCPDLSRFPVWLEPVQLEQHCGSLGTESVWGTQRASGVHKGHWGDRAWQPRGPKSVPRCELLWAAVGHGVHLGTAALIHAKGTCTPLSTHTPHHVQSNSTHIQRTLTPSQVPSTTPENTYTIASPQHDGGASTECRLSMINLFSFSALFLQFSSVAQSCPTLCDPMECSTPGLPVHHQLPAFAQSHVHQVGDAIQPSHPLSSPSPPAFNLSQHQGLFQ